MLHKHYAVAPIIIIDEYDTPIQQGYQKDYYDKVIRFMRNLFSGGFKDNQHLSFGFLTGILRVAKESIFSEMNNLSINSVLDNKYSAYFGFTADEVMEMAEYYGAADKYDEILPVVRRLPLRQDGNFQPVVSGQLLPATSVSRGPSGSLHRQQRYYRGSACPSGRGDL